MLIKKGKEAADHITTPPTGKPPLSDLRNIRGNMNLKLEAVLKKKKKKKKKLYLLSRN